MRQSPRARRQAKRKARIARLRASSWPRSRRERLDTAQIRIPPGPRLGDLVVEADGLSKGYGDRLLIDELSFSLPRGGIVGVIGANGAGKTTLFRMIAGEEQPDGGELRLGETVDLAYVDQSRDALDGRQDGVGGDLGRRRPHPRRRPRDAARAPTSASFNFKGGEQQKKVGRCSRAASATACTWPSCCASGGNLLLLDEPTNDLDVDTLRALEEALLGFAGCAVVISHDRWFLDRIATHVLAFEGDCTVRWFEGNFEDYEEARRRELGAEADRPHRITYKQLVRG